MPNNIFSVLGNLFSLLLSLSPTIMPSHNRPYITEMCNGKYFFKSVFLYTFYLFLLFWKEDKCYSYLPPCLSYMCVRELTSAEFSSHLPSIGDTISDYVKCKSSASRQVRTSHIFISCLCELQFGVYIYIKEIWQEALGLLCLQSNATDLNKFW